MIVFSCGLGTKDERTPRPVFRLDAVATVRSLRVVLQGWRPRFSLSHGGPLVQTSREVVFETVYCHAQVFESGVKYPAVMLWDSHILC